MIRFCSTALLGVVGLCVESHLLFRGKPSQGISNNLACYVLKRWKPPRPPAPLMMFASQELYYKSDFGMSIPKGTMTAGSGSANNDDRKHRRPHWSNVARTLLHTQFTQSKMIMILVAVTYFCFFPARERDEASKKDAHRQVRGYNV